VQRALQDLYSAETTMAIQERNRNQARLKYEKATLELRAGNVGNREVVDAQNELTTSENGWYQSQAAYRTVELALRHAVGVLNVQEDGAWDDLPPAYATFKTPRTTP